MAASGQGPQADRGRGPSRLGEWSVRVIADLHLHSRHSLATSRSMDIPSIAHWAKRKGIDVVGTGDFTHPQWMRHLEAELTPADGGWLVHAGVRFALTAEVALVWRQAERTRKLHLLLVAPAVADAKRATSALSRFGKLASNGRPMLGVDCVRLLDALWGMAPGVEVIPAHIWTPWYSLFGSRSGFDDMSSCFAHHLPRIHAVETGLSSDPAMNGRVSLLDSMTLVSFSDAHSPSRLGREATVFELGEPTLAALLGALAGDGTGRVVETFEVPPEHGKYHFDGHRSCGVRLSPVESRALDGRCPVCGKELTLGVLHRVGDLADREDGAQLRDAPSYRTLLPLHELISLVVGASAKSRRVEQEVQRLTTRYGTELTVLMDLPVDALAEDPLPGLRAAVSTLREGRLCLRPGYDGVYGEVALPADAS